MKFAAKFQRLSREDRKVAQRLILHAHGKEIPPIVDVIQNRPRPSCRTGSKVRGSKKGKGKSEVYSLVSTLLLSHTASHLLLIT